MSALPAVDRLRLNADLMRLLRERAALQSGPPAVLMLARNASQIVATLQKLGLNAPTVSIYNSGTSPTEPRMNATPTQPALSREQEERLRQLRANPSPAVFSMTLGTAQDIVSRPQGWRSDQVAEARIVVDYWRRRSAKATQKKAPAASVAPQAATPAPAAAPVAPLTIDDLTAQAAAALDATPPKPKFGSREASVSTTLTDGSVITCTMADVYVNPWKRRGMSGETKRTTQYKRDGKVISKALLLDVIGGKDKQEINEVLRAAFEAYGPELAREYREWIQRAYEQQKKDHGGRLPAYPKRDDPAREVITQTLAPHCKTVRGEVPEGGRDSDRYTLELDTAKLAQVAQEYGEQACMNWFYKTNAKLGPLEHAELHRSNGGDVEVTGVRNGHNVRMSQQRIMKATQAGALYHQWPARLYVDGKFMPEAIYAKAFKD